MKLKHIIAAIMLIFGILACIASVGHLDYLNDSGEHYGVEDVKAAIVKSTTGIAFAGVGVFLCRDVEIEESGANTDEDTDSL